MNISIVVITYNNYYLKNGCIESVILSILNQNYNNYEIIVVDNSDINENSITLNAFVNNIENQNIRYIKNDINNISAARNIGVNNAKNDMILFLDDDLLLLHPDTLQKLMYRSKEGCYGFGAVRIWSNKDWYTENKQIFNQLLIANNSSKCLACFKAELPNPKIRNKDNNRHLVRTYIGNFGFANREALAGVGFWDCMLEGYGAEDDLLIFKLYMKYGNPVILNDITVYHIWHEIFQHNYTELEKNNSIFQKELSSNNIKEFHIGRLLYNEGNIVEYF